MNRQIEITDWDNIPGSGQRQRYLTPEDVTNQGRFLLSNFVYERMESQRDGLDTIPSMDQLQEPGAPQGPRIEYLTEFGRALRAIGDDIGLDRNQQLEDLASQVPPEAEGQTLLEVASYIFKDGINWGRIVVLFYFAYKICAKVLDRIPLIRTIISVIVDFMREHVVNWIIEHGGWEAIREYVGCSKRQIGVVLGTGLVACIGVLLYHKLS